MLIQIMNVQIIQKVDQKRLLYLSALGIHNC